MRAMATEPLTLKEVLMAHELSLTSVKRKILISHVPDTKMAGKTGDIIQKSTGVKKIQRCTKNSRG